MSLAQALAARPLQLGERLLARGREALLARAQTVAVGGLVVSAAAIVAGLLLWAGQRFAPPPVSYMTTVVPIAVEMPMALAYALVGAVLVTRQPRNAIGWLFLAIGIVSSLVPPIDFLVAAAGDQFVAPSGGTVLLAWLASNFQLPMLSAIVIVVFLIFPDGHALSARWARAGWLAVAGALVVGFGEALDPSGLRWFPTLPNPTAGPSWFGPVSFGIQVAGMVVTITALGAATWAMVLRWRGYGAQARRGLATVAASVLALAVTGGTLVVVRYALAVGQATGEVVLVATLIAATTVPLAAAFGMLRYRLFDVDLVLAHALVYVPLTGFLAGLYAAAVALFTRVFVALTGNSSDVVIVLATLVLAGAFTPVRKALETFVDRHFKPGEPAAERPRRRAARAAQPGTRTAARTRPRRLALNASAADPIAELHELQARMARLEEELGASTRGG